MKTQMLLVPALALGLALTGCVGTGPNTQQGAVTGGALGALAGAIIGANSRGGDALAGAIIGGTAGAIAGGTLGNAQDNEDGTVYGAEPPPESYAVVQQMPPPPPPQPANAGVPAAPPAPNALWIPGYWSFDGYRYTWAEGHWEVPPANARSYIAAHWESRPEGYVFVRGYWE
ncbi:MAG TPA: hypothetical protein VHE13_01920 [Opitutus sp.]|nr:hypothetical protein [Opitutus sp.]